MQAFVAERIFDGSSWHEQSALVVADGRIKSVVLQGEIPREVERIDLDSGLIAPGLVDLQVNGGGGLLFNDMPTLEGIRTICSAHLALGTTSLFPTLISDTSEVTRAAISAAIEAGRAGVPGYAGLHLEGPHLDPQKSGAHDPRHLRPMTDADLDLLVSARAALPALIVTIAPEAVSRVQVRALVDAGVTVSLGHSNCSAETAHSYFEAGARLATHLFNAMSGITARAPGLAAGALTAPGVFAGLIADGHHVAPEAIRLARAKTPETGGIFLVSDAMPVVGTRDTAFALNGRTVTRRDGKLTFDDDGTLAGADLCLVQAIRYMRDAVGVPVGDALSLASSVPARAIGLPTGRLAPGAVADFIHLDDGLQVSSIYRSGIRVNP